MLQCLKQIYLTVHINDIAPQIVPGQSFSIAENEQPGYVAGVVQISRDRNSIQFAMLDGNTGGAFAIDGISGTLSVANQDILDYEKLSSYALTIQVTDGTHTSNETVHVHLTDVDETIPVDEDSDSETPDDPDNSDTPDNPDDRTVFLSFNLYSWISYSYFRG